MRDHYSRPTGVLRGLEAACAVDRGDALWLAGGPSAFTHVEILCRGGEPKVLTIAAWVARSEYSEDVARITRARAPIAGMDFSRPRVMGVLNVTPDSFSDGGKLDDLDAAILQASAMAGDGADIWDVGGESTRPGSDSVGIEQELDRVLPIIQVLKEFERLPISIDSRKPEVFGKGVKAGASVINDVSALTYSPHSLTRAAELQRPVILMHAQGDPKGMQSNPTYDDVVLDVFDYLEGRVQACEAAGLDRSKLIVDPGIGFGKTVDHNLKLLRSLSIFHGLGAVVLLGASRKSFIEHTTGLATETNRLGGSLAAVLLGLSAGVQIFRVHDVQETAQALRLWSAIDFEKVRP